MVRILRQKEFEREMNEIFSVDRIQDEKVICEDEEGNECSFPLNDVFGDVKEGKIIRRLEGGRYTVDEAETEKHKQEILELKKYIYGTKR